MRIVDLHAKSTVSALAWVLENKKHLGAFDDILCNQMFDALMNRTHLIKLNHHTTPRS